MPDSQEIQSTFCRLMARGWVVGAEEVELPELLGFKCIIIEDGDWRLLDAYCTPPGNRSWGLTTLTHDGVVALTMEYGGWYEKNDLRFLKDVLLRAYSRGDFYGGRGQSTRGLGGVMYSNRVDTTRGPNFHGRERIYLEGAPYWRGEHYYSGMIFPSSTP